MTNDKFVQLHGPFEKDTDLVSSIRVNYPNFSSIKKIGIQSIPTHICYINNNNEISGQKFEIGKTGILEFNEVNITSIKFSQDEPETTLVDCILG